MGILEAVQEEVKKYAREYLMHEDAKKVISKKSPTTIGLF
jgi:hypothetical protein